MISDESPACTFFVHALIIISLHELSRSSAPPPPPLALMGMGIMAVRAERAGRPAAASQTCCRGAVCVVAVVV